MGFLKSTYTLGKIGLTMYLGYCLLSFVQPAMPQRTYASRLQDTSVCISSTVSERAHGLELKVSKGEYNA